MWILYSVGNLYLSGSSIPVFTYKSFYSNSESLTKLPSNKTIILFFTAECGSCDDAASSIYEFSKGNKEFNFVFITEETNKNKIKDYIERNKIKEISDYVFIDSRKSFQKDFGLGFRMSIPTILYYDEKGAFVTEIKNHGDLANFPYTL
jgi:thiol-disulfide isomerase/thioredoxin